MRTRSLAWTLPLAAVLLAVAFMVDSWNRRGPTIQVQVQEGHGIRAGDDLAYRGIRVGEVESVDLSSELEGVVLSVRLDRSAQELARAGSRFWIARPVLGLEGVQGLETLLGTRYLAVLPGPVGAGPQREFVALAEPPLPYFEEEDGLEIVLEASTRSGLARGAPLSYRGIDVGNVLSVGLAPDASAVEVRARIRAPYRELVREDTRFWERSGASLTLGLDGLELDIESLRTLLAGGIALATPSRPGARAVAGQRFELASEPEEEWLEWRPALPLGGSGALGPTPELVRVQLSWVEGRLLSRERARSGWLLPTPKGLVGPADLLIAPEDAKEGSCALELAGERIPISPAPLGPGSDAANGGGDAVWGALARRAIQFPELTVWTPERTRGSDEPEDCLVVADPSRAPIAVSAAHLERVAAGPWRVSSSLPFEKEWHGAAVLARSDGLLVGLLLVDEGRGTIAPLPPLD